MAESFEIAFALFQLCGSPVMRIVYFESNAGDPFPLLSPFLAHFLYERVGFGRGREES